MRKLLLFGCFLTLVTWSHAVENIALTPLDSAAYYLDREQSDEAIRLFASTAKNEGASSDQRMSAYAGWVKALVFKGEYSDAAAAIEAAEKWMSRQPGTPSSERLAFRQSKGEYYRQTAEYEKALEVHLDVLNAAGSLQPPDSALLAMSHIYVAATYEKISDFKSAISYGEKGYALCRELYSEAPLKMVSPTSIMAVVYYRMSMYDSSFVYYDRAIGILKESSDRPTTQLALLYGNLGAAYNDYGDYEKAISLFERALAINRKLGAREGVGYNLFGIGSSYFFLGDYGRSVEYMKACLAVRDKVYPDGHYLRTSPKEIIGIAQYSNGNYVEGMANLKRVLEVRKNSFGAQSLPVAFTIENIAISFNDVGQSDSALAYMERSMAIYREVLPENHTNLAHSYFNLATFYNKSDDYEKALQAIEEAVRIFQALDGYNALYMAQNYVLQGEVYVHLDQYDEADASFAKAFDLLGGHPLETPEKLEANPTTLDAVNTYLYYRYQRHNANGVEGFQEEFEALSQLVFTLSDQLRRQFNDPYTKEVLMRKSSAANRLGVGMNYALYRDSGDKRQLEGLFRRSEFGRANLFRDMIDDYKVKSFSGIPDSLIARETQLKKSLAEHQQELLEDPNNDEVRQKLFETKESYNLFIEELQKKYPRYHNLKYKSNIEPIPVVQKKLLDPRSAVIEYMADDTAYYGLILTRHQTDVLWLGNIDAINKEVTAWNKGNLAIDEKATLLHGERLYRSLIQPFEGLLKGSNIIIIPAGRLYHLSFEALNRTSQPDSYLIYDYSISYGLSVNTLMEQTKRDWKTKRKPVVIAPGFESDLKTGYLSSLKEDEPVDSSFMTTLRQPWSIQMADRIARRFRGKALLNDDASEASVKSSISNRNVVHFATHAVADHSDPLRSMFILAKTGNDPENDGYLYAYEIYELSLHSELTVLAACESGKGKQQDGEGMISLAYSINYAGCPSVVMSLWKIDEKINNEIVFDFYKQLDLGMDKSKALRKAKLKYLETASGVLQHPFYWSGLVVMGDPGPVRLDASDKALWKWLLILGVFLLIPFTIWRQYADK